MRELNECTAEVFRRSKKRIRERRRKRNRVLALCVPICLIVAVWSAIIFPGMIPAAETGDQAQAAGELRGDAEVSIVCPYTAVEIQDAGMFPEEHHNRMTDTAAVAEMFRAIHSLFGDGDVYDRMESEIFPAAEDNVNRDLTDSASIPTDYTITFTAEDRSQAVYHLSENTLLNVSTNETVFLSDAQVFGLLAVLGISE